MEGIISLGVWILFGSLLIIDFFNLNNRQRLLRDFGLWKGLLN